MKIAYLDKRLGPDKLATIAQANRIIADYQAQGFQLTLRQLYYQFVARDLIPNTERSYKNLGETISDGRLCGRIDWEAIEDRTRSLRGVAHWESPQEIVSAVAAQFRIDKWATQPLRIEVWIEKDALIGVIEGVCRELDVSYFSCRGYTSQSEMWVAAQRLAGFESDGQRTLILHFGDHDPSGKDMSRDIQDRLALFRSGVEVRRMALTMKQVRQYRPPPNPAKVTDSRAAAYIREFGRQSWELDALEPAVIAALIRDEVMGERDEDAWAREVEAEDEHRSLLKQTSGRWDDVVEFLKDEEAS